MKNILNAVKLAYKTADDKLGEDILVLDVRKQTALTDYFIFITGTSHLHIRALEDALREELKKEDLNLKRTDGKRGHLWRALDYGRLIIHLMDKKTREFYAIERLWDEGEVVKISSPVEKKKTNKKPLKKVKAKIKPKTKSKKIKK
ncbi:MAG: ribosome silencing factor [Elusimicrobiota bacterium]